MALTRKQIAENYRYCLQLTADMMRRQIRQRSGRDVHITEEHELVLTAVADPAVIGLISSVLFDEIVYQPILLAALDLARRELFPDAHKKRFVDIAVVGDRVFKEIPGDPEENSEIFAHNEDILSQLSLENNAYLMKVLLKYNPNWRQSLLQKLSQYTTGRYDGSIQAINDKVVRMRACYPDGKIIDTTGLNGLDALKNEQIVACYKNVYCSIERGFPIRFLQRDAGHRAALITRFLVENILNDNPALLLDELEEVFFIRYQLQNVYRLFNYSANRALHNAYPKLIPRWVNSRADQYFWETRENRQKAVRWLVEEKMELIPGNLRKSKLNRRDFAEHGLSFLYNQYYNSVSRALQEAYPEYLPWELGPAPESYWNDTTSANAVRRVIDLKRWSIDSLPQKVKNNEFNRYTFSEFGLATLFDKKFGRNIFRAVDAAWPGRFMAWELGNVPAGFWRKQKNIIMTLGWIAEREGFAGKSLFSIIENRQLTGEQIKSYPIGKSLLSRIKGRLNHIFTPVYSANYSRKKIINRLEYFINRERQSRSSWLILLYGISYPLVCRVSIDDERRYQRILRRIRRY